MDIELEVSGFKYKAFFSEKEIEDIYIPLLKKFSKLRERSNRRIIIFLAAPPAVGKSTLALFLEKLSNEMDNIIPLQSLSLDGFHYHNDYLNSHKAIIKGEEHLLYKIKGMPETFDLENFKKYLKGIKEKNIKWPIYDRNLHNPVMDQLEVKADIVLIEGNWLLLNEHNWNELNVLCDYSIFIEAKESILKDRLVQRKIRGGVSEEQALEFYERTDKENVLRAMKNRIAADLTLEMLEDGEKVYKR